MKVSSELKEHWLAQVEDGWLAESEVADINAQIVWQLQFIETQPDWAERVEAMIRQRSEKAGRIQAAFVARNRLERDDYQRMLKLCQLHGLILVSEGGKPAAYELRDELISE